MKTGKACRSTRRGPGDYPWPLHRNVLWGGMPVVAAWVAVAQPCAVCTDMVKKIGTRLRERSQAGSRNLGPVLLTMPVDGPRSDCVGREGEALLVDRRCARRRL